MKRKAVWSIVILIIMWTFSLKATQSIYPWFKIYSKSEGLGSLTIKSFAILNKSLYVATADGLYLYSNDKFTKQLSFKGINSLAIAKGALYLITYKGIYKYFFNEKMAKAIKEREYTYDLCEWKDSIYFSTISGLYKLGKKGKIENLKLPIKGQIKSLFPYKENLLLGIYGKGVFRFNGEKFYNLYQELGVPLDKFNYVTDVLVNQSTPYHHLFVALDNGALEVDLTTKVWQHLKESIAGTGGFVKLGSKKINRLYSTQKDPQGGIWFATPKGTFFYRYNKFPPKDEGFFVGEVPKNTLSPAQRNKPQVPIKCGCKSKWQHLAEDVGLIPPWTNDVVLFNDYLWLATNGGGVYKIELYYIDAESGWDYLYEQSILVKEKLFKQSMR